VGDICIALFVKRLDETEGRGHLPSYERSNQWTGGRDLWVKILAEKGPVIRRFERGWKEDRDSEVP